MFASTILAFALFGQPHQVEAKRVAVKPLTLIVSRDRFTGKVSCVAKGRGLIVQDGVAVFDLGARVDTARAAYKLDRGQAQTTLAPLPRGLDQALIDRTPLENPSNGLVALPVSALTGAGRVDIRANPNTAPVGFDTAVFKRVLDAEAAQGCAAPATLALAAPAGSEQH